MSSSNTAFLRAASILASKTKDVEIILYPAKALEAIPHFNPDQDIEGSVPRAVMELRLALKNADGIWLASPEYAGGIAGALKNSLDWMVSSSSTEVYGKAFALHNISNRANKAYEDLKIIVKTMGGTIIESASLHIPMPNSNVTTENILENIKFSQEIQRSIKSFYDAISIR